jgi:hypothetical protein
MLGRVLLLSPGFPSVGLLVFWLLLSMLSLVLYSCLIWPVVLALSCLFIPSRLLLYVALDVCVAPGSWCSGLSWLALGLALWLGLRI